jgi:DNA-binding transcriptional MerR regulator
MAMKTEKRKMRIGELAQTLNIERFVIRFWEKEFELEAERSHGGQRFYDEQDIKKFCLIKELLYTKKYTIAGAKRYLKKNAAELDSSTIIAASKIPNREKNRHQDTKQYITFMHQLRMLQQKLLKLRELL